MIGLAEALVAEGQDSRTVRPGTTNQGATPATTRKGRRQDARLGAATRSRGSASKLDQGATAALDSDE